MTKNAPRSAQQNYGTAPANAGEIQKKTKRMTKNAPRSAEGMTKRAPRSA